MAEERVSPDQKRTSQVLTKAQIQQFRDEGYLVIRDAFDEKTRQPLRQAIDRIVDEFDPQLHSTVFKTTDRDAGRDEVFFRSAESIECFLEEGAVDGQGQLLRPTSRAINKIGHALHDLSPGFADFCALPFWSDTLSDLGLTPAQLWQTMVIFKQPGIGGEVRWHQDASYLATQPASVLGCWIALEDAGLDNGCLWVAPGGHKGPLREIYQVDWEQHKGTLHTLDETPWPDESAALALEVPAGSLVLFSDLMPHYSSANRSDRSRLAMTLHFAPDNVHWLPQNWLQRHTLKPFLIDG
jgi:phytanoyl-CoA hydroxylase